MKRMLATAGVLLLAVAAGVTTSFCALAKPPAFGSRCSRVALQGAASENEIGLGTPIGSSTVGGNVRAGKGAGYLVSKVAYADFQLKAEFWADEDTNSGIFIRCSDPEKIAAATCYEVNIFDKRPEPAYGTGAIVNVAKVEPMPKAAGKWNTYEITAQGPHLVVVLNGVKTVDVQDSKHAKGVIALSAGRVQTRRRVTLCSARSRSSRCNWLLARGSHALTSRGCLLFL